MAINYSADIYYKDFLKIYREYTEEPINFLTINTTLPANNPLRFRKNLFDVYKKLTVTDHIKILNRKVKLNEAQYNVDRKTAKIFALSSNNLDKYEYLTGEDLDHKPSFVKQVKLEYSPLCKIFIKGLDKQVKKEGLLKRLQDIEDNNEELLHPFSKESTNKVSKKNKQNKNLVYNSQHCFVKFKDIDEFKELSLDSIHKKLEHFHKKFTNLKNVVPQTEAN